MLIHNAILTGSISLNGSDVSNITGSAEYSASFSSRITNTEATGSTLTAASSSFSTRTTTLEGASGSFSTRTTTLEAASASFSTRTTTLEGASGSFSTRVTSLTGQTGSYVTTGSNSFKSDQIITGSVSLTGNVTASNALYSGNITAQTLVVQTVTSSVLFSTGSNKIGSTLANVQEITGSLYQTGSVAAFAGSLGVGTNSPSEKLDVSGAGNQYINVIATNGADAGIKLNSSGNRNFGILSDGSLRFYDFTASAERMRINPSGSLLVGFTSAFGKVSINIDAAAPVTSSNMTGGVTIANTTGGRAINIGVNESGAYNYIQSAYVNNADVGVNLAFFTGATERMRITTAGNVGVGVTSLGSWDSTIKAIEVGTTGNFYGGYNSSASVIYLGTNAYYNSGWKYATSLAYKAQLLDAGGGNWHFQNAASGSAGGAITWTSLMKITDTGNLNFYNSTSQLAFYGANNFQINFGMVYNGSNLIATATAGGRIVMTDVGYEFKTFSGITVGNTVTDASRVKIANDGNVGIGSGTPNDKLQVGFDETAYISIGNGGSTDVKSGIRFRVGGGGTVFSAVESAASSSGNGYLAFSTIGSSTLAERMRIISSGNVGIGITNPSRKFVVSNGGAEGTEISPGSGYTSIISYNRSTSTWIPLVLQEGTGNVLVGTTSDNGYKFNVAGSIYASGAINAQSSMYANGGIGFQGNLVGDYGYSIGMNSNTQVAANAWYMQISTSWSNNFRFFYGGTGVGAGSAKAQIDTSGNYSALSDVNKKKDIVLSTLGLNEILQLKPSTFKFKDDENEEEQIGFIAQEVKEVIPHAYYEDAEGDDKFIGLKYNAIVPVLVKAIQELKAEIEILKNR